jgi:hypothetical protein
MNDMAPIILAAKTHGVAEPQPNPSPRETFRSQEAMNHFLDSRLLNFLLSVGYSAGSQHKVWAAAGYKCVAPIGAREILGVALENLCAFLRPIRSIP